MSRYISDSHVCEIHGKPHPPRDVPEADQVLAKKSRSADKVPANLDTEKVES